MQSAGAGGGGPSYDSDAVLYFTAAGITDLTQKSYFSDFIIAGKAHGWWAKRIAGYPNMGGNASAHAVNAFNPGTFDGTFHGSPTHGSDGVQYNGSTQYMSTGIVPSAVSMTLSDNCLVMYSLTSGSSVAGQYYDIGSGDNAIGGFSIFAYRNDNTAAYDAGNGSGGRLAYTPSSGNGRYIGTSKSGSAYHYKNGTQVVSGSPSGVLISQAELYVGAFNEVIATTTTQSNIYYSPRKHGFDAFFLGLTSTQALDLDADMAALFAGIGR